MATREKWGYPGEVGLHGVELTSHESAVQRPTCLVGCSRPPGPALAPVEGVVTKDGQPISGAQVMFNPEAGRPSIGQTDAEGRYSLRFTADRDGAMLGNHQVTISYGGRPEPGTMSETGEKRAARGRRGIPKEVNWPDPVVIEDKTNQVDFAL